MSAIFNAVKATALPQSPAPHTLYYIKGGSDVRVKGYVSDANGTVFPLGIIDEQDVLSVQLDGFTVGNNTPINSTNSIFNAFRNVQAQINTLSSAVAGGIKIPQPINASTNPNYPPAQAGDSYLVTVDGLIGGPPLAGESEESINSRTVAGGDKIIALTTNAGGTHASVGSAWYIVNGNIDKATTSIFGTVRTATQQDVTGFSSQEAYVSPATLAGGVRASLLTGFAVGTNTAIGSGDSVLQAFGKVQGQLDARLVGTTIGRSMLGLADPSAITFPRFNANNTVSALSAADFRTAIGAGTGSIGGTIASGQVAFGTGANTIGGDSGLVWDNVNKRLRVGTTSNNNASFQVAGTGLVADRNTISGVTVDNVFISQPSNFVGSIFHAFDTVNGDAYILNGNSNSALVFGTRISPNNFERWRITPSGILQSNGAQTIQTSTGNLTLATGGGNGNILLSPNGTGAVLVGTTSPLSGGGRLQVNGQLNVATVNNATGDFLTHVNGIVNKRTAAQVRAEIVVWTEAQW